MSHDILVELGVENSPFRMLIDGGRASAKEPLSALLANLPKRAPPALDVVVLTHVDADHIEGLLDLLDADDAPEIGEFNGGHHLLAAAGIATPARRARPGPPSADGWEQVLSIAQGIDFSGLIEKHGGLGIRRSRAAR